jgi:predicted site-specific integrase-resolvase
MARNNKKINWSGEPLLTKQEVAQKLRISIRALDLWINANKIPVIKLSPGCVRFDPEQIKELIDNHKIHAAGQ